MPPHSQLADQKPHENHSGGGIRDSLEAGADGED